MSSPDAGHAPLELATYVVREVVEAGSTGWRDGVVEVGLRDLEASALAEPGLTGVRAHIVRPGEPVRVANVLDAVDCVVKPADPEATFPGALGVQEPHGRAGTGRTNRLDGLSVLTTLDVGRLIDEDDPVPASFVDMYGPGAALTPLGGQPNVVLELEADAEASLEEVDSAARRAGLRAARDLAAPTAGAPEDRIRRIDLSDAEGLPAVCVILQVTSEGPGLSTLIYGRPAAGLEPHSLDPREVLDGAITSGAYDSPSARNPTSLYQRSALLHRLLAEHGRTLRFAGVVLTLGYLDDAADKRRYAAAAAEVAKDLGAVGAILTTYSLGNSHTDTMLTCRACEQRGIRTVAIVAEEGGLTDHVLEADALVSVGNVSERVPPWRPERLFGAEDAVTPHGDIPVPGVPLLQYLGATSQLGDLRLRGVSA